MTTITEANYFTKEEALEKIGEALHHGFKGGVQDLHHEVFNTDYYIIGTSEAEKALEEYGVFNAIRKVREYEESQFGKLTTPIEDSEKLSNMLFYIIGEEVLYELVETTKEVVDNDYQIDETISRLLMEEINK